MIEDPPLLTIRSAFPRPAAADVAAFAGLPTGYAVDAMGGRGALDHVIKPLWPMAAPLAGVALTCHCGPADNLALFAALASAQPGDILVAATDGYRGTAVTGDLLMGMARNLGVAALVTDGMVRDIAGLKTVGLPIFCAGLTPNSPVRNGPGTVGRPVVLGGVTIASGDILLMDDDGVAVIPRDLAAKVAEGVTAVQAAEAALEAKVKAGLGVPDFISAILTSPRCRYED